MAKEKETSDPRQAYTLLGLVLLVAAFFGYAILPKLSPAQDRLVGLPAPDFTLPVVYGGEPGNRMRLGDLRGKTVLLDFWASWCAPCRAQATFVDEVAKKHHDDERVVVLGVNTADAWDAAVHFAQDRALAYPSVIDKGPVAAAFHASSLPTLVVVDAQGLIRSIVKRTIRTAEIEALLSEAQTVPGE